MGRKLYIAVGICLFLHFFGCSFVIADRFQSKYDCVDASKSCVDSGKKMVEGFEVAGECWRYSYNKVCKYPSKDDCSKYGHCYSLGLRDCLLRDSMNNCINIKKEFNCKRWQPFAMESETIRIGTEDKEGEQGLVCKGIPCIDGNCIDKSYEMDSEMVASISQLGALAQGQNTEAGFKIFAGNARHCAKKVTSYQNCCQITAKGWGQSLGAKCTSEENLLAEQRQKNLCVYVGKESNKVAGVTTVIKHHFCCFSNILEKTVQVQGRAQLGMNFGNGGSTNCRGLTLEEIARLDWSKIDFAEVAAEVHKKVVLPKVADIEMRVKDSLSSIKNFDTNLPESQENRRAGVSGSYEPGTGKEEEEVVGR